MNHINDPEWRENLPDLRLAITQQDINLKKNFDKKDFAKNASLKATANVQLSIGPSDITLVQDEDALSEVLDIEMDEQNTQSIEQREKETEKIKRKGD